MICAGRLSIFISSAKHMSTPATKQKFLNIWCKHLNPNSPFSFLFILTRAYQQCISSGEKTARVYTTAMWTAENETRFWTHRPFPWSLCLICHNPFYVVLNHYISFRAKNQYKPYNYPTLWKMYFKIGNVEMGKWNKTSSDVKLCLSSF